MDLVDFFRGRYSWRKLLVLIGRLPSTSATVEAQLDDPEFAEWALSQPDGGPRGPRLSEWSAEVNRLTDIHDRLGELINAVVASAGAKPKRVPPTPRPYTALDRARLSRVRGRHAELVAEVKAAQERWARTHGGEG